MTKEEAISYLQQLYHNGWHCWLDEQRIEAIGMAVKALQEEPVSEDLLVAANKAWLKSEDKESYAETFIDGFVACFNWQKRKDSISSKDLEELINTLSKRYPEVSFAKLSRIAVRVAKWQKERDEADRAAVYKCGWNDRKAVMMAKAIDGKVIANGMGNPILHLWDKGKHLIDKKVKVILIKEG